VKIPFFSQTFRKYQIHFHSYFDHYFIISFIIFVLIVFDQSQIDYLIVFQKATRSPTSKEHIKIQNGKGGANIIEGRAWKRIS
jgi:hypothetical protein